MPLSFFNNLLRRKGTPEWNGDPKKLPPMGQPFLYKGEEFTWEPCRCGEPTCHRPEVFKNGELDYGMTIRMRGTNQGLKMGNVLVKLGKLEELAAVMSGEDAGVSVLKLFLKTLDELPVKPSVDSKEKCIAFLRQNGITEDEMAGAVVEGKFVIEDLEREAQDELVEALVAAAIKGSRRQKPPEMPKGINDLPL